VDDFMKLEEMIARTQAACYDVKKDEGGNPPLDLAIGKLLESCTRTVSVIFCGQ
jgi:hypothetical protein